MNGSFPYTSSWIGSLGEYPIYNYIKNSESNSSNFTINTSNTLEIHLSNTSNILENHSSNYTNSLRYDVNKWINEVKEPITVPITTNLTHTYIYNSNLSGEIRFWCKSTPYFPPQIPGIIPRIVLKLTPMVN